MVWYKGVLQLALAVGGLSLAGCSSKAALPARKGPQRALPETTKPSKAPERVSKPAPRELAFSVYSNPEYGVSFRYPRNFALFDPVAGQGADEVEGEGDLLYGTPNSGVRSQEELESEQPGAVLVASVVVPDDTYPNTTFAGGSLQFAVNRYQTAGSCRANLIARLGDSNGASGEATFQGVPFAWMDDDQGDGSTEYFERDYAGFSNGTCYAFFLRVGVGSAAEENAVRPADEKKILAYLEKIVSSVQFESKNVSALDGAPGGRVRPRKR
jgi:hypothetical protein